MDKQNKINSNQAVKDLETKIKYQNLTRKTIRTTITLGIVIIALFVFKIDLLNDSKDTFTFTNYGFAIMYGYASICFSWAKSQHEDIKDLIDQINFTARASLYIGIVFLMGSIFKYVVFVNNGNVFLWNFNITFIPYFLSKFCLFFAILGFSVTSVQIMKIIDKENHLRKMKQFKSIVESNKYIDDIEKELMDILDQQTKRQ